MFLTSSPPHQTTYRRLYSDRTVLYIYILCTVYVFVTSCVHELDWLCMCFSQHYMRYTLHIFIYDACYVIRLCICYDLCLLCEYRCMSCRCIREIAEPYSYRLAATHTSLTEDQVLLLFSCRCLYSRPRPTPWCSTRSLLGQPLLSAQHVMHTADFATTL